MKASVYQISSEAGKGSTHERADRTKVPYLNLRFAEETDVEIILGLIRGLADYERLSHEVTADAETLRCSLFGARRVAEVVSAEIDGTPVGFALFFHQSTPC